MLRMLPVCASLVLTASAFGQAANRPLRVAIYPFDATNVKENIKLEIGRNIDYGQIAADLLRSKLISPHIEVINRDQMERLLKEQNLKYNERFDPSQATQFGKMLNVDAIITGKIDTLHTETKETVQGVFGVGRKKTVLTAVVGLTSELIATATAKTLAAPASEGKVEKDLGSAIAGTSTTGTKKVPPGAGGSGQTTTSKSLNDPYIRDALKIAVDKVASDLRSAAVNVPPFELARVEPPKPRQAPSTPGEDSRVRKADAPAATPYVKLDDEVGAVLEISGDQVTFELDETAKVAVGDSFEIQKAEIKRSPRTGKEIAVGKRIGTVRVSEVRKDYSRGKFEGQGISVSDRVVKTVAEVAQPKPVQPKAAPRTKAVPVTSAPSKTAIPAP